MRLVAPPVLKTAFLYGLLTVSQAFPTSHNDEIEEKALQRRVTPPLKPVHLPDGPAPPPPPPPPPKQPVARPGAGGDPVVAPGGGAEPPRLGTQRPTNPNGSPVGSTLNPNYDAKIANYFIEPTTGPMSVSVGRNGRKWFNDNGVNIGGTFNNPPAPSGTKVKIYGASKDVAKDPTNPLETIWEGQVDAANGVMIRSRQFRTGNFQGKSIDDLYPGIPAKDRIFMSDHLVKTWMDYGGGGPLKKLAVTDIDNEAMKPYLQKAIKEKGSNGQATFKRGDPEFEEIMKGSVGSPLKRAADDRPDIIQGQPSEVTVMEEDGLYAIISLA